MKNNLWYTQLVKSPLTPPDFVFSIVWPLLYCCIVASFFIFWSNGGVEQNKLAVVYFILQMALNVSWPYLFFKLKSIRLSFTIIILLWVCILLTILQIRNTSLWSAYLLFPYLLWVSFAVYLNGYIYKYSNI